MKRFIITALFFSSSLLQAEIIQDRIHSIEEGLIKFENGRVAFQELMTSNLLSGDYIRAELNEQNTIINFERLNTARKTNHKYLKNLHPSFFEPTTVPSMKEAMDIFHRSNPYSKRVSECTDRAHVWAHDEFKFSGTKSRKVFVFFTASYINSVRFKWWFHVAPLYRVNDQGTIRELAMDYRYSDRPQTVKEWTNLFVYTKRDCKVTTRFSDYELNPQAEDCFLIFESMHYKLPSEIYDQELSGKYKTSTTEIELQMSLRHAFEKERE